MQETQSRHCSLEGSLKCSCGLESIRGSGHLGRSWDAWCRGRANLRGGAGAQDEAPDAELQTPGRQGRRKEAILGVRLGAGARSYMVQVGCSPPGLFVVMMPRRSDRRQAIPKTYLPGEGFRNPYGGSTSIYAAMHIL